MQSDCKGNGVRSRHIPGYGAANRKICLGNEEKYQFSHIKQFQIFFSVSQPLIFMKCLRLSGRYVFRLQMERCQIPSHSLVWGHYREICLGNDGK